jgi:hypothetical protein
VRKRADLSDGPLKFRFANKIKSFLLHEAELSVRLGDQPGEQLGPSIVELPSQLPSGPIRRGGLEPFLEINDPAEGIHEISETAGRQHNCIASPTHILGDLKKTPTLILFQVEKENFSIHLNFFGGERIIRSVGCITVNHSLLYLLALRGSATFFYPIPFDETFMDFSKFDSFDMGMSRRKILKVEANSAHLQAACRV